MPAIRSSRFDLPLTYDAGELDLQVGHVVRVPLGSRQQLAFVISRPETTESSRPLRRVIALDSAPRAFDETGLTLARFIAEHYLCTLPEALGAVTLSVGVPRVVDTLTPVGDLSGKKPDSVPPRFLRLLTREFAAGFSVEQLLRHPEARRTGDRPALLRYTSALVRAGLLHRERRFIDPRVHEYRVKLLVAGNEAPRGARSSALARWVGERAPVPRAGAVLAGFSPALIARALRFGAIAQKEIAPARSRKPLQVRSRPALNAEQRQAVDMLRARLDGSGFAEVLLHGITASGKTLVYIETILRVLQLGGRAIVLVPEISLTPQTARRFEETFGERVAVLHSALSQRERYDAWQACRHGEIDVVVGARSAVFAPLRDVKLIVVDESHEPSYKQQTVPRYHAVTVARERMRIEGGLLVLGSATPSIESYAEARMGRIACVALRERASGQPLPLVNVVDMSQEFREGNRRIFSSALAQALDERMRLGEKTVLFVNRRGSASFLLCRSCGFVPQCPRCSVSLAVHRSEALLRCHYCDAQFPIPQRCVRCGAPAIREFGAGTERVALEVQRLFPEAKVVRMDSDTTTHIGDHARLLDAFASRGDVLVGTQMVAKGLDFPTVTLVGVIAADIGLHAPEFRASERTFDLIMQVCGRSGRARPGVAIVQTYAPGHPAIRFAAVHDYEGFAERELAQRVEAHYPPAWRLIYLAVIGRDRAHTLTQAKQYAQALSSDNSRRSAWAGAVCDRAAARRVALPRRAQRSRRSGSAIRRPRGSHPRRTRRPPVASCDRRRPVSQLRLRFAFARRCRNGTSGSRSLRFCSTSQARFLACGLVGMHDAFLRGLVKCALDVGARLRLAGCRAFLEERF